jgi:hypothetical protein
MLRRRGALLLAGGDDRGQGSWGVRGADSSTLSRIVRFERRRTRLNSFELVVGDCCSKPYPRRLYHVNALILLHKVKLERVMGIEPT